METDNFEPFEPDYEPPETEYQSPYPENLFIYSKTANTPIKPPEQHAKTYQTSGIRIVRDEKGYLNIHPHISIRAKIFIRGEDLFYDEAFITNKSLIKLQMEKDINIFSIYKLKYCDTCQEHTYNIKVHKKGQKHSTSSQQLDTYHHLKRAKTDTLNRIIDCVSPTNGLISTDGTRKVININEKKESVVTIYLKNSTSRRIKLVNSCGSNKNKGYITFITGQKLGDFEIYNHEEILEPNQQSTTPVNIWTHDVCASSDLTLEIIIQELDSMQIKRVSQRFTVYKNYNDMFYDSNVFPKTNQWKNFKNIQFNDDEEENTNIGEITKSNLMTPNWTNTYKHIEFNVEQNQTFKTDLALTSEESTILETIRQETNQNNFIDKSIFMTLAELSFYFDNQNVTDAEVTKVVKHDDHDIVTVNTKKITTAALYLKTGDRTMLMIKDVLVIPAKISQIDSEEMVLIVRDRNIVRENDPVKISPTLRIQPYTIQLNCLEKLKAEKNLQRVTSVFFTPTDSDCPPIPQDEIREIYEFENNNLDDNQRAAVIKTLQAPVPGPPQIIIGPPGTGKTTTTIEYIVQESKRNKQILVLCPTNHAVCSLHHKLANMDFFKVHQKKILKFSTPSMKVSPACYQLCTSVLTGGNTKHTYPTLENIKAADIILATLTSSHRLGCIKDNKTIYFKEVEIVVIDESSFTGEAAILIPLMTQIANGNKNFKIVLVGDPKQIRQIPRSYTGKEAPKVDIISRLMSSSVYKSNPHLHQHLKNNYRNARSICQTLKKLVYGNDMISQTTYDGKISFHHSETSYLDMKTTSKNSLPEVEKMVEIFTKVAGEKVLPTVLTFYSAQANVTQAEAKRRKFLNFHQVRASTAESIQGNEADDIIISMCLPQGSNAWQNDLNRSNVLCSRAKNTVSVIGDCFNIMESKTWSPILRTALLKNQVYAEDFILQKLEKKLHQTMAGGSSSKDD